MKFLKIAISIALLFISGSCTSMLRMIDFIPSNEVHTIEFTNAKENPNYEFYYATGNDFLEKEYLTKLRTNYLLDSLVLGATSQLEKVKRVLYWTSKQWEHNGSNQPKKRDAISILKEAKEGKSFRCVEYGIVSSAALNSIGITSRVLGLATSDVENVKYAAGHVAAESFLSDIQKWVFFDAQFNYIPVLNNIPLNAVEFQKAILENRNTLKLVNLNQKNGISKIDKESYLNFVAKHLFYFDVLFDNRIESGMKRYKINGNHKLTLVPVGHKEPKIFQKIYPIHSEYTNSLKDFYRKP